MIHSELQNIKKQNLEAKLNMYKEIFFMYLKCLFYYPEKRKLRKKLLSLMKGFFISLKNEEDILEILDLLNLTIDDYNQIINYLNYLMIKSIYYYENILENFDDAIKEHKPVKVIYQGEEVKMIDEHQKQTILKLIMKKNNSQ